MRVDRVRKRGIKGLGQPLKSFRDNPKPFNKETINDNYLKNLGKIDIPEKGLNLKMRITFIVGLMLSFSLQGYLKIYLEDQTVNLI